MSENYSCFDVPVDLSLSGSQVSPPRKAKPSSAKSTSSTKMSSSLKKNTKHQSNSSLSGADKRPSSSRTGTKPSSKRNIVNKGEKSAPSLAMAFPSKENKRPIQTNLSTSRDTSDYVTSFFNHQQNRTRTVKSKSAPKHKSRYTTDRVFDIPQSARSGSIYSDGLMSNRSSIMSAPDNFDDYPPTSPLMHTASGDANVDFLKSYLSNVDKYKDPPDVTPDHAAEPVVPVFSKPIVYSPSPPQSSSPGADHKSSFSDLDEDEYFERKNKVMEFKRNHSAKKIQTWYRRHSVRRKTSQAAMKRMLSQKKEEMENNPLRESLGHSQRSEQEKKRQREERAKAARKQAIKDLQEKREAKQLEVRRVAEEEIELVKQRIASEKKKTSRSASRASSISLTNASKTHENQQDVIDSIFSKSEETEDGIREANKDQDDLPSKSEDEGDVIKSHTTLDDVLATIKQLEEEPLQLKKPKPVLDDKLAWIDDLESELRSNVSKTSQKSKVTAACTDANSLLTEAKLQSINNFLDEVEKIEPVPVQDTDVAQQIVQAEQVATEVTSEMLKMKLNLEEKSRSVTLLQNALVQQREMTARQFKEQEIEFNHRMKMQKDQYESTIQRHLSFIDQLIDDKKVLNEKCEKLVAEMKQAESKYKKKIKDLSEAHQNEMKKTKDVLSAAEKLRREKWIDEKTKKIKEMTVKGLEPEIQRLIAKHKEEMKKTKAIHEAELLRSDERAGQRYIRQTEELREQLEREKEAACTREREMARQRYEKQMEQEEIALQQQRKRLFAEVAEEKERLSQQATRQRSELDELKQQIEGNSRIAASALREEFEKSAEEASKRHKEELRSLHDRLEIEKQAWQENYMKKQESFMMQKERELKESVRRDRDSEIETAILRLEDDMHHQREELEKTTENRIKRIRDKYEAEMREVERSEKQAQDKYNNMKAEYNDIESENLRLQSLCKQREQEVADMTKIKTKLVEERGNVSEVIRQEFADRLVITDEENKRMKTELSEMRARHRLELERINNEKEEELSEVHKRVRQAIVKKEETISQIRDQYDAAVKRADHLESLLEQQRKKLLGKKKSST